MQPSAPHRVPVTDGMPGHLIAVVISHAEAPIADWQSLVLDEEAVHALLQRAAVAKGVRGVAVLATCSRTDLYAEVDDPVHGARMLRALLQRAHDATPAIMARTRVLHGAQVAAHLLRVTSGLESIALGEHEIQGQVRRALQLAGDLHLTSPLVHRLFERALATGGRVRHETLIGHGATTLGHAAAEAVAERSAPTPHSLVVVVGAGHMAAQAARLFRARGFERIVVVNRSAANARRLADQIGGFPLPWSALPGVLGEATAVVAAVRTNHPVIDRALLERARANVRGELQLVDLGSPPNIAPDCATLPGVRRIDLDALHDRARRSRITRAGEVNAAQDIVDEEVARFVAWCEHRRLTPAVRQLLDAFRAESALVVARESRRAGSDPQQLQRFADALVRRLLHRPMVYLQAAAREAAQSATPTDSAGNHPASALSAESLILAAYVERGLLPNVALSEFDGSRREQTTALDASPDGDFDGAFGDTLDADLARLLSGTALSSPNRP